MRHSHHFLLNNNAVPTDWLGTISLGPLVISLLYLLSAGQALSQAPKPPSRPLTCSSPQGIGIIPSKPACFPAYGQVFGGANLSFVDEYVQGPEPIKLDNGDIVIYVNANAGPFNGSWHGIPSREALEVLHFPNSSTLPPRWYPIYATDNWGLDQSLKEYEAGFAVLRYFNGYWRLLYTSSLDNCSQFSHCGDPGQYCGIPAGSPCSRDYDRTARIDLLSPTDQPAFRSQWWLQPLVGACQNTGVPPLGSWGGTTLGAACPGSGTGFAQAVMTPSGTFYVYHNDGNAGATCPPINGQAPFIRHRVNADMTYTFDSCISGPIQPFDIGRSTNLSNTAYYMLGASGAFPNACDGISEYISTDGGITFNNTSPSPKYYFDCSAFGLSNPCFISEAAYLKDKTGLIISPRMVVGMVGSEVGWNPPTPVGNDWRLVYWTEPGVVLPASWGSTPVSCPAPAIVAGGSASYGGNFDLLNPEYVYGWAWDWYQPSTPISVDVYADSQLVATALANEHRNDLAAPSDPLYYYGNGNHGFTVTVPHRYLDGQPHTFNVRYAGTQIELPNSPRTLGATLPVYDGSHDSSDCCVTTGWVYDAWQPNTPLAADLYVDDVKIQTIIAGDYRDDLRQAGKGNGYHAFTWSEPASVRNGGAHTITVKAGGSSWTAMHSPIATAVCPAGPLVAPPAAIVVNQSVCCGETAAATPSTSAALGGFVIGGSATATCPPSPTRLTAQINGNDISGATCFGPGTTAVTFRFRDGDLHIGTATSYVTVHVYGDLNLDSWVDASDLVILQQYLKGAATPGVPPFNAPLEMADVDHNTTVDTSDLVRLRGYLNMVVPCLVP